MPHVNVPRELLEAELARYLATGSEDKLEARAGAERHRVLPLFNDFMGCWALDMTGRLVFFRGMRLKRCSLCPTIQLTRLRPMRRLRSEAVSSLRWQ
jgi:hypothetical protein